MTWPHKQQPKQPWNPQKKTPIITIRALAKFLDVPEKQCNRWLHESRTDRRNVLSVLDFVRQYGLIAPLTQPPRVAPHL